MIYQVYNLWYYLGCDEEQRSAYFGQHWALFEIVIYIDRLFISIFFQGCMEPYFSC